MRKTVPVLLVMTLALSFLLVAPSSRGSSHWSLKLVDDGSGGHHPLVGFYSSLALDAQGNPHISYSYLDNRPPFADLRYARWDGTMWRVETVEGVGRGGLWTSLALDESGHPHISHYGASSLRYARWDGTTWHLETVDMAGAVGLYSSLALDASGNSHISYYHRSGGDLKYARWTGTAWQIEVVDSAGDVGSYTSLALDGADNPHISYYDETNEDLKYARWDGAAWSLEIVDAAEQVGEGTSLALDASGAPHISYYDEANEDLKYARWTGTAWQIEVVDSAGDVGSATALTLDGSGKPAIVYQDWGKGGSEKKFARWTGTGWSLEFVDRSVVGTFDDRFGLVLDEVGNPHISYGGIPGLKYAVRSGGILEPEAPRLLTATSGNEQVTLTWSRPSDGGSPITSYRIYRGTASGSLAFLVEVGGVLAYTDLGLTNGVAYYYQMSAVNGVGEGPRSDVSATPGLIPSAPQNLQATAGDGRVGLAWQAPASDGGSSISNYRIYRAATSGGFSLLVQIGGVLEHTDTGLTNGVTYSYQITAVSAVGEGARSNRVSATPAPDTTNPTITITSPIEGATLASTSATVSGTASDDAALKRVELSTDEMDWVLATGKASWSAVLTLAEGENTIFARATDTSGNAATMSIAVTFKTPTPNLPVSPLVITAGIGAPVAAVAAVAALLILRSRGMRKGEEGE